MLDMKFYRIEVINTICEKNPKKIVKTILYNYPHEPWQQLFRSGHFDF